MSSATSRTNDKAVEKSAASNTKKDPPNHFRNSDSSHYNSHVLNVPEAKWIHVYINGDEHFSGYRCVVNSRYYRNLDMFLNYLTERLQPSFGAVRNIYTPVSGHPVHSLDDLISKHKYVVAGNERFKKLEFGYMNIGEKKPRRNGLKSKSKFKVSKAKSLCHNALSVNLYRNGNFKMKPTKISFLPQDLENWEAVFKKISEILKCGPVKRICTLSGKSVRSVEDLLNNQTYVAIGKHEVFKAGGYGSISQRSNSSAKGKYHGLRSSRKSSSMVTVRSSGVGSRLSAQSLKFGFSLSSSRCEVETPLVQSAADRESVTRYEESDSAAEFLTSTPAQSQMQEESDDLEDIVKKIKIDLDNDFSGIFRSKIQNNLTVGAVEIEDSPETMVDLPVDLLEAEEVEDEITPDMERSLQHLSLDVPDEIVAFLPSMQKKQSADERKVSANKYNLSHSQTLDIHNIFV